MLAEVAKRSVGAEQVARRSREDDLPAVCSRGDARGTVHVEADVALLA